jgi:hypothetical protein
MQSNASAELLLYLSSTRQSIIYFFPDLIWVLERWFPFVVEWFLPLHVSVQCPYLTINAPYGLHIVQPTLAFSSVLGAVIGICGFLKLMRHPNLDFSWSLAFLFFGLMNIDGFCLHCLPHEQVRSS